MYKIAYAFLLCLLLVGCASVSGEGKSDITLETYIKAFENEGVEIDTETKPLFGMIGAVDGIMFNESKKIVIYEFDSQKAIKAAEESLPAMKEWERNGLFVLETKDEESKKIFNDTK